MSKSLSARRRVPRFPTAVVGESRTLQYFKDDCDINVIMSRFLKSGELPSSSKAPSYGDFSSPVDFQESLNIVMDAEDQFSSLPSRLRARFDNSPLNFLQFVSDPNNSEELVSLGLAVKRPSESDSVSSSGGQDGHRNPPRSEGSTS